MKKTGNIIKNIFVWLIMIFAIGMMIFTIFSVMTFDQSSRSVFGYKFFIVRSDSMSATDFEAGDIIFVEETDPSKLQAGDIIAYSSQNTENFGETVTHKIRAVTVNEEGETGFVTYGTTTNTDDKTIVTYANVLGKYKGRIPKAGEFFAFLKTTPGYVCCILIPFLLLIIYNGVNCIVLLKRYRKEQMRELRAERRKLEEERRQSAEMMKEIQLLKKQLSDQAAANKQSEEDSNC